MALADFAPPRRLMAGGGPSLPDPRVLRALTTPLVGQFDPAFTAIMDEVMAFARGVLLTANRRCFPISALASGGVEALRNTLPEGEHLVVVEHVDEHGAVVPLQERARHVHADGAWLIVDATRTLGGVELRTDDWNLDAVVAGVDHCLGAPSGMTLVTYSEEVEQRMLARAENAPRTSYLDLLQVQAYWSAERLNHHTAPTSLVYGLREALRLVLEEGLEDGWTRHARVGQMLRAGLRSLGLEPTGGGPFARVELDGAAALRTRLLEDYGVYVQGDEGGLSLGLLGADAQHDVAETVLAVLGRALAA